MLDRPFAGARRLSPILVLTFLLLSVVVSAPPPAPAQVIDTVLHVDRTHEDAADDNVGTRERPLRTIQEAADRAIELKRDFVATRVLVQPGTYRESIDLTTDTNVRTGSHDPVDPDNTTPIVFEASDPGSVVITGSDVWTGWESGSLLSGSSLTHEWPYDWEDGESLKDRREMVFADGELLQQVEDGSLLGTTTDVLEGDGTFYVDEANSTVHLSLPSALSPSDATIEVGAREILWNQLGEDRVTVRGIVFRHAVTPWEGGEAAVRIVQSDHVTLENCRLVWNNWQGLFVGDSRHFTIRNSELNNNGGQGWATWKVRDFRAIGSETSYNNWRGALGDHYSWNVGNKLMSIHGLVVRDHRAVHNRSRGLWLDFDVTEAVLENVHVAHNRLDGIWFEASRGPITLEDSEIADNGRSGLRATYVERVTLRGNLFARNAEGPDVYQNDSQIILDGGGDREVEDFETGEFYYPVIRDWTVRRNRFEGGEFQHDYADGPTLVDTDIEGEDWSEFVSTLSSDGNAWYHPDREAVFGFPDQKDLTLEEWRSSTGQDRRSVWGTSLPSEPSDSGDTGYPEVRWDAPSDTTLELGASPISLQVSASDPDGDLDRVEFYRDGSRTDVDTVRPYETSFTPDEVGTREFLAEAVDAGGRRARSSRIYVTVTDTVASETDDGDDGSQDDGSTTSDNQSPRVRWVSPSDTTVESGRSLELAVESWDGDGDVREVVFFADGDTLGRDESRTFGWSWTPSSSGTYTVYAEAFDEDGANSRSSEVSIDVVTSSGGDDSGGSGDGDSSDDGSDDGSGGEDSGDGGSGGDDSSGGDSGGGSDGGSGGGNAAPAVAWTRPTADTTVTRGDTLDLRVEASDEDGTVARVVFLTEGDTVGVDSTRPFGWRWAAEEVRTHRFTAETTDDGGSTTASVERTVEVTAPTHRGEPRDLPSEFVLHGNYPNPFNPTTTIAFDLPVRSRIVLEIYGRSGRLVRTIRRTVSPGHRRTITFDGGSLATGLYLYRIEAIDLPTRVVETGKMTLLN